MIKHMRIIGGVSLTHGQNIPVSSALLSPAPHTLSHLVATEKSSSVISELTLELS